MRQQILHTPEGVRDIYGIECRRKLMLEEKLQEILHLYGYQDIQTPMFEFFDVFGKEIGTISSKELYKFFDRDGNTLVLRNRILRRQSQKSCSHFFSIQKDFRSVYVIMETHLSTIRAIVEN